MLLDSQEFEDRELEELKIAISQNDASAAKPMVLKLQTVAVYQYSQEKVFDVCLQLLEVSNPKMLQFINMKIIAAYCLPSSMEQYLALEGCLNFLSASVRSLAQEELNNYMLLEMARRSEDLDLYYLQQNVLRENSSINANLLALDTREKVLLVLNNYWTLEKLLDLAQLREKVVLYDLEVQYTAATRQLDLQMVQSSKLLLYVCSYVHMDTLLQGNQGNELVLSFVRLYEQNDIETIYFCKSILRKTTDEENSLTPLWKMPCCYQDGRNDRLSAAREAVSQLRFEQPRELCAYLQIRDNELPLYMLKMLLYQEDVDTHLIANSLTYLVKDRQSLIINIQPVGYEQFMTLANAESNSSLRYSCPCFPLAEYQRVLGQAFQCADAGSQLKITDKILQAARLSDVEVEKYRSYITSLPLEEYSSDSLLRRQDYEIVFCIIVFARCYDGALLGNSLRRYRPVEIELYELQFETFNLVQMYDNDGFLFSMDERKAAFMKELKYLSKEPVVIGKDELIKQLFNIILYRNDEAQQFEILAKQFADVLQRSRVYEHERDITILLEYIGQLYEPRMINIDELDTNEEISLLLADRELEYADARMQKLLLLCFSFQILNREVLRSLVEAANHQVSKLRHCYIIAFLYLRFCELKTGKNYFHQLHTIYSEIGEKEETALMSFSALTSPALQDLLIMEVGDFKLEGDCGELLKEPPGTLFGEYLVTKCTWLAKRPLGEYTVDQQSIIARCCQTAYADIFVLGAKYYLREGDKTSLFDKLELYDLALKSCEETGNEYQRLELIELSHSVSTATAWRESAGRGGALPENAFDDLLYGMGSQGGEGTNYEFLSQVQPFALEHVCYATILLQQRDWQNPISRDNSIIRCFPNYLKEPFEQKFCNINNAKVNCLTAICESLNSALIKMRLIQELQNEITSHNDDSTLYKINITQNNISGAEIRKLIEQACGILPEVDENNEYYETIVCEITEILLEIIAINESYAQLLQQLLDLKIYGNVFVGILSITETINKHSSLKHVREVSKLIKELLANGKNQFIIAHQLDLHSVNEQNSELFVTTILKHLQGRNKAEIDCSSLKLLHPISQKEILFMQYRRFSSLNIVLRIFCTYSDSTQSDEVLKLSDESYANLLKMHTIYSKINYCLSLHPQVFGVRTIEFIPTVPFYQLLCSNVELKALLEDNEVRVRANLFVTIMPYMPMSSVFGVLSKSALRDDLLRLNLSLDDSGYQKIAQFTEEEFVELVDALPCDYLLRYVEGLNTVFPFYCVNNFVLSYSVSTLICALLGIGDRHLDNICVDNEGNCIEIDFEHIFFKGLKSQCEEVIPMRYTKVFEKIVPKELFKYVMLKAYRILKEDGVLNEFVAIAPNSIVRLMIQERINGKYAGATEIEQELDKMIEESVSHQNLYEMFSGWMPWL